MQVYNSLQRLLKILFLFITDYIFKLKIQPKRQREIICNNKVLFVIYDRIGDNVVRTENIKLISEHFKHAKIYYLVNNEAGLLEYLNAIQLKGSSFILFERKRFMLNPIYRSSIINSLNTMQFKKTVVFGTGDWTGKKYFINYIDASQIYFYTSKYEQEYVLEAEAKLHEQITDQQKPIQHFVPNLHAIVASLTPFNRSLPNNYVVIGIGASSNERKYPINKFVTIINFLFSLNKTLVFLGKGKADQRYYSELIRRSNKSKNPPISLINQLSFPQSMQVLLSSQLYVGVESALFNAASFLKVPAVIIYGGGHYGRFMHPTSTATFVYNKMNCYGCGWKECKHGILKYTSAKCVSKISPQNIIDAIDLKLKSSFY